MCAALRRAPPATTSSNGWVPACSSSGPTRPAATTRPPIWLRCSGRSKSWRRAVRSTTVSARSPGSPPGFTTRSTIRPTARHDADAAHPLDAAFHDADLWILSAAQERFDEYCEQVRLEYAHVPDREYRTGRAAILGPLLHRDRIYRTSHALHAWETPARINLGRELTRLRVSA